MHMETFWLNLMPSPVMGHDSFRGRGGRIHSPVGSVCTVEKLATKLGTVTRAAPPRHCIVIHTLNPDITENGAHCEHRTKQLNTTRRRPHFSLVHLFWHVRFPSFSCPMFCTCNQTMKNIAIILRFGRGVGVWRFTAQHRQSYVTWQSGYSKLQIYDNVRMYLKANF